jgi:RNA polymerase sigma-70 factor (ECF subfamily)
MTAEAPAGSDAQPRAAAVDAATFQRFYDDHFAFVWRSVRRLGVAPSAVDDLVQEVFLVAHRRLATFEGRSRAKTWLFGIVLNAVRHHRRSARRRPIAAEADLDAIVSEGGGPLERTEERQAVQILYSLLDALDDDRREVFVLAELEGLTAPEIAELTGANVNTVYGRLRAARQAFEAAVARLRARERRTG